jgi:metal-responsive CopG/Arc/MetJ family transcriptional regulator
MRRNNNDRFPSQVLESQYIAANVPISMPQTLLADIDSIMGDKPRSVFVCKILRVEIKEGKREGGRT